MGDNFRDLLEAKVQEHAEGLAKHLELLRGVKVTPEPKTNADRYKNLLIRREFAVAAREHRQVVEMANYALQEHCQITGEFYSEIESEYFTVLERLGNIEVKKMLKCKDI